MMKPLGYFITAMLYLAALSPLIVWVIRKLIVWLRGMKPRIVRVPNCHGAVMVSGERASFRPNDFIRITPWCWRRR